MSATATVTGLTPGSFQATAAPGLPTQLIRTGGDQQSGQAGSALPVPLTVLLRDSFGNPVPGTAVAWTTSGGGSLSPAVTVTDAEGRASTTWTLGPTVASQSATASVPGLPPTTFSATVTSDASFTVIRPAAGAGVRDTVNVLVRGSTSSITGVTATIDDRSVALTLSGGIEFTGILVLAGLPPGARDLVIHSVASNGDSAVVHVPIVLDRLPHLAVKAPVLGQVARPELQIAASCIDDDPAGCARVDVFLGAGTTPVATGTNGVHRTISLAVWEGQRVTVRIRGVDSRGQASPEYRAEVFVETSSRLTEIAAGRGRLLDIDATRLLFIDSSSVAGGHQVVIRDRATSAETRVPGTAGSHIWDAFRRQRGVLHASGALFGIDSIYDWRSGTRQVLGSTPTSVRTAGHWAIWSNPIGFTTLHRRDLRSGETISVADFAGNVDNDVAPNGDVVFWGRTESGRYEIFRYRDGSTQLLTTTPADSLMNVFPVTDGVNVVFTRQNPAHYGIGQRFRIVMIGADGQEIELAGPRAGSLFPHVHYAAAHGWVAYTFRDAGARTQISMRAPDGATRQATALDTPSHVVAIGPNGELVFDSGGRRYVIRAPYNSAPVDIGAAWGTSWVEWRNGELVTSSVISPSESATDRQAEPGGTPRRPLPLEQGSQVTDLAPLLLIHRHSRCSAHMLHTVKEPADAKSVRRRRYGKLGTGDTVKSADPHNPGSCTGSGEMKGIGMRNTA